MNTTDLIMDLMSEYEWMTASIARFLIERNIDIAAVPELQ